MIAHIDVLLARWGRWSIVSARREVGYSPISPMFKTVGGSDSYGSGVPSGVLVDCDMSDIDRAVQALPVVHRSVVTVHYQYRTSKRETALKCGIKRGLLDRFLDESHRAIDKWLHSGQN